MAAVIAVGPQRLWAVATCNEKTIRSFLGVLCMAAAIDWI